MSTTSTTSSFTLGPALLFCPADRPDRFGKAAERADGVVLDLEDAVANKDSARQALVAHPLDPENTLVRVNSVDSGELEEDLSAVREAGYHTVMLSKMTGPEDVQHLDDMRVVALCETARGVLAAPEIAAEEAVVGLMWGAEDLMVSLGGTSSRFSVSTGGVAAPYRPVARHARSRVLLAARAYGKAAIDAAPAEGGRALIVFDQASAAGVPRIGARMIDAASVVQAPHVLEEADGSATEQRVGRCRTSSRSWITGTSCARLRLVGSD